MSAGQRPAPGVFCQRSPDEFVGTPLAPSAMRVMLLGSGEVGKEVLIALQRLGVETITIDRYAGAPGQQVAHRAHTLTMSDGDAPAGHG